MRRKKRHLVNGALLKRSCFLEGERAVYVPRIPCSVIETLVVVYELLLLTGCESIHLRLRRRGKAG